MIKERIKKIKNNLNREIILRQIKNNNLRKKIEINDNFLNFLEDKNFSSRNISTHDIIYLINGMDKKLNSNVYRNNDEVFELECKLFSAQNNEQLEFIYKMCTSENILKVMNFENQIQLINNSIAMDNNCIHTLENIYSIVSYKKLLECRTADEITDLVKKYVTIVSNNQITKIENLIFDKNILELRTNKELLKLIDKCLEADNEKKLNYTNFLCSDYNIIKNRTIDEQLRLINKFLQINGIIDNYDSSLINKIMSLFTNKNLIKNRTTDEQLKLIDRCILITNNYKLYSSIDIATNENVLKNRSLEEQLQLINKYLNIPYETLSNKIFNSFIINPLFINGKSSNSQIRIIQKMFEVKIKYFKLLERFYFKSYKLGLRTEDEIDKISDKLIEAKTEEELKSLLFLSINQDILNSKNIDEHLELLDKVSRLYAYKQEISQPLGLLSEIGNVDNIRNIDNTLECCMDTFFEASDKIKPYCKKK